MYLLVVMVTPRKRSNWSNSNKDTKAIRVPNELCDRMDLVIKERVYFSRAQIARLAITQFLDLPKKEVFEAETNKVIKKPQGGGGTVNVPYLRVSQKGTVCS